MAALEKHIKVLVIEDNPGDFVLIEEYLEELEHPEIQHVRTLVETTNLLNIQEFDVILLDLSLPDAHGESLVKAVVKLAGATPIIVLTGYENREFGLKTLGLGISDYLLKDELNSYLLSKSIAYSIERFNINSSLRASEKQYRDIFSLSPQPMWVYDSRTLKFLEVNDVAIRNYGYSREEFLSMTLRDINPKEDIPLLEKEVQDKAADDEVYFEGVFRHLKKDGTLIDVELKSSKIIQDDQVFFMVLAEDITERLAAEKAITQKSKLLEANARITSALIENEDWLTALDNTFDILGEAMRADRVYYFDINESNKQEYASQKIEWTRNKISSQIDNPVMQNIPRKELSCFMEKLENKQPFHGFVEDLPESHIKDDLINQEIQSLLLLPVFNPHTLFGFLGFDACTHRRKWTDEEIQFLQTIASNISNAIQLRQAAEDLKSNEQRFRTLVQDGSDLLAIMDENGVYKYVAPNSFHILGIPADEFIGKNVSEYLHDDYQGLITGVFEKLANEDRFNIEPFQFRDGNGDYRWIETTITNMMDNPAVQGFVANSRDVTKQIERENKLQELSLVASKTTDLVIITDDKGLTTWVNDAFNKLTGYTLNDIQGKKPGDLLQGPDTDAETVRRISNNLRNLKPCEEVILNYTKNGTPYWQEVTIDPIFDEDNNCTHFIAIQRNVTEKIENEKELKRSLERYDIVSKATSDTIWDLNLEDDTMLYNSNIYNMFGYKKNEVQNVGAWWRNKIHPHDQEKVTKTLASVFTEAESERLQLEYRFEAADGTYKHIFDRAFIIKNEEGKPVRMIGAMQDVTQDVLEAERLKLLESVITNTSESVVITEIVPSDIPERKIFYVNKAFSKLTGYSKEDVLGKTLAFLNGKETDAEELKRIHNKLNNFEATEAELINYKKNGEKFWINTAMVPVSDKKGNYTHWVTIGRDVTDQKKSEEEIRASLTEKETLLSEIHHRVKNNLAVVSGMMQLQALETENEELQTELYDSVFRIQTMAAVHELLYQSTSFSKLEFSENLKKLVRNISDTLQSQTVVDIDFKCDPVQLNINQAIPASLIVNEVITNIYKHAFNGASKGKIKLRLSEKNNEVSLKISDNGSGFRKDFNPENSSSLGFHIIKVLTEQLEGDHSYTGSFRGTTFKLTFTKSEIKGIGNGKL